MMYAKCPFCGELRGSPANNLLTHLKEEHSLVVRSYNAHTGWITVSAMGDDVNHSTLKVEFCEKETWGKMEEEKQPRPAGVAECEELLRRTREGKGK